MSIRRLSFCRGDTLTRTVKFDFWGTYFVGFFLISVCDCFFFFENNDDCKYDNEVDYYFDYDDFDEQLLKQQRHTYSRTVELTTTKLSLLAIVFLFFLIFVCCCTFKSVMSRKLDNQKSLIFHWRHKDGLQFLFLYSSLCYHFLLFFVSMFIVICLSFTVFASVFLAKNVCRIRNKKGFFYKSE